MTQMAIDAIAVSAIWTGVARPRATAGSTEGPRRYKASEYGTRRHHRYLLPDDLKDERAKQIEGRQSLHPCVRIKGRVLVDHPGEHGGSFSQPRQATADVTRLLRFSLWLGPALTAVVTRLGPRVRDPVVAPGRGGPGFVR